MKKFHSNLRKFHDIGVQQTRMAELELARRKLDWETTEQAHAAAVAASHAARESIVQSMRRATLGAVLQGMKSHLAQCEERAGEARRRADEALSAVNQARARYQQLKSREESLAQLIDQQRQAYRMDVLQEEQAVMDDAASSRWTRAIELTDEVHSDG